MSAYLIFTREKTLDEAELKIYWDKIRATFAGHQVKVLVNYGRLEGLEGDPVEGYRDRGIPELRSGQGMVRSIISLGGIMTDSYPFTVFGGEFKGKRVLVTGDTLRSRRSGIWIAKPEGPGTGSVDAGILCGSSS